MNYYFHFSHWTTGGRRPSVIWFYTESHHIQAPQCFEVCLCSFCPNLLKIVLLQSHPEKHTEELRTGNIPFIAIFYSFTCGKLPRCCFLCVKVAAELHQCKCQTDYFTDCNPGFINSWVFQSLDFPSFSFLAVFVKLLHFISKYAVKKVVLLLVHCF